MAEISILSEQLAQLREADLGQLASTAPPYPSCVFNSFASLSTLQCSQKTSETDLAQLQTSS